MSFHLVVSRSFDFNRANRNAHFIATYCYNIRKIRIANSRSITRQDGKTIRSILLTGLLIVSETLCADIRPAVSVALARFLFFRFLRSNRRRAS